MPTGMVIERKNLIILLFILLISCASPINNYPEFEKILGGKYELRKLNIITSTQESSRASYFLIMGNYSYSNIEKTVVKFYFLNYLKEYQLMEADLSNVNIKIDNSIIIPYVTFEWQFINNPKYIYSHGIKKIIIHCKDEDFKPEININNL